ncbi:Sec-independent protein translocase protein TatB [Gordonia sp. VNK1]|uniref:Sec-independent protein translocase protein TatB n=1 Tax=Gordonia oleivorans TaxID=3156618 RepID=UPI0032B5902E
MFDSVGWGEIFILIAAALVILGPERLPGAISWTMQSVRKARDYATGATDSLKNELGTDFDDLRKPLADLNELRGMTPRSLVTKHLLNGDESVFSTFDSVGSTLRSATEPPTIKPVSKAMPAGPESATPTTPSPSSASPSLDSGAPASDSGHATARGNRSVTDWDAT